MSAQTQERTTYSPAPLHHEPDGPAPTTARASRHDPTPGYAATFEIDGFDTAAQARDALAEYAAALVHLGLTPDWGVRMLRQRISRNRVAWFVMLDGPESGPPASLAYLLRRAGAGDPR